MSETRRKLLAKLKRVLVGGVDGPLKAADYRKRGFRYLRLVASGLRHIVEVERGRFPAPDEAQFTVSCGAHLEEVWLFYPQRFDVGIPQESSCLVRSRIGSLGPKQLDTWWTVSVSDDETALARLADDLHRRLVEHVLPWLAQFHTPRSIGEYLVAPGKDAGRIRHPYREIVQDAADLRNAAIGFFAAGDHSRAMTLLDLAAKTVGTPRSKEMTAELRERMERLIGQRRAGHGNP